ncbi:unnamed protein product [Haemonchus placei]|uniref:HEPN domain-containing protein n=1 Tax=Haemonchus placei TaxID=6290 RepID=A0A0N4WZC7_HAEPC|nr:unnamed protein product [Haemonchus placei]
MAELHEKATVELFEKKAEAACRYLPELNEVASIHSGCNNKEVLSMEIYHMAKSVLKESSYTVRNGDVSIDRSNQKQEEQLKSHPGIQIYLKKT